MSDFWMDLFSQPLAVFRGLDRRRQAGVVIAAAVAVVVLGYAIVRAGAPAYSLLYAGLPPAEASQIVGKLDERGIQNRIDASGTRIEVPSDEVGAARLVLGETSLPSAGGAGYELFDESDLILTDRLFDVKRQRAMEGELRRTLETSDAVRKARVHFTLPEKSVFRSRQQSPTASITLTLRPGFELAMDEVASMAHVAAAAIGNGIQPRDVTITDSKWQHLYPPFSEEGEGPLSQAQQSRRRELEEYLQRKAESLITEAAGPQKAAVRVALDLDPSHRERQSELFSDDNSVKVRETSLVKTAGSQASGGDPGVGATGGSGGGTDEKVEEIDTESLPGVTRELSVTVPGEIRRLSVSLLLDESLQDQKDGLEQIVKGAVGFDEKRKDTYQVHVLPFHQVEVEQVEQGGFVLQDYLPLAGHLADAVVVLVVLIALSRLLRGGKKRHEEDSVVEAVAESEEPDLRGRLSRLIEERPDEARDVLATWVHEEMS